MRILVVDDEVLFVELIIEQLRHMGLTDVTSATSGKEALSIIDAQPTPFDCLLLDIFMHGIDGVQLCEEIRKLPDYRTTPILMITSADAKTHMQSAFDAGATDYVPKPIRFMDLKFRIQVAMMLIETVSKAIDNPGASTPKLALASDADEIDTSVRITFSEVHSMRDYFQLENRLLRLGEGQFRMTLLSVHLSGIEEFKHRMNQKEFLSVVFLASQALDKALPTNGTIFSYVGYGKFICLILARNQVVARLLQARVRDDLANTGKVEQYSISLDVKSLSAKRILSPSQALNLIRKQIERLGSAQNMLLPPISTSANKLFSKSHDME